MWGDQCPADEICEYFDSLEACDEALCGALSEALNRIEFENDWREYCAEN